MFLIGNTHIIFFGISVVVFIAIYKRVFSSICTQVLAITPCLHPPRGMTPGMMRYFMKRRYDDVALTADIVNMAVQKMLTIVGSKKYALRAHSKNKNDIEVYNEVYDSLFCDRLLVQLDVYNHRSANILRDPLIILRSKVQEDAYQYFFSQSGLFLAMITASIGCTLLIGHWAGQAASEWMFIAAATYILLHVAWFRTLNNNSYTDKALVLKSQIEGFKMYLSGTDLEKMKRDTLSAKNQKLYEAYLPYAIALEIEEQWTAQFPSLTKNSKSQHDSSLKSSWYEYDDPVFRVSLFYKAISDCLAERRTGEKYPRLIIINHYK